MRLLSTMLVLSLSASACQLILGIEDRDPFEPEDAGPDGPSGFICDPVAQLGCEVDEKCASVIEPGSNPPVSRTDCVPDGALAEFDDCQINAQGFDECQAGFTCAKGFCTRICPVEPGSCSSAEETCLALPEHFSDQSGTIGGCDLQCDAVFQDCNASEACYLNVALAEEQCRRVPPSQPLQEEACLSDDAGCLANGCAVGYGPHLPATIGQVPSQCGFYCTPADTFISNTDLQFGDGQMGFDCFASFKGTRPDGPGDRQCRFLQTFTGNTDIDPAVGMCVDVTEFGDCGDCDIRSQETAMLCPPGCISKATFDSLPPT